MLQLSRDHAPLHYTKPYFLVGYGSKSIGEPDWRPHPRNALSDPDALPFTEMGSSSKDWISGIHIRRTPPLEPINTTETRRRSSNELKNKDVDIQFSPKQTSSRKNSSECSKHNSPKNSMDQSIQKLPVYHRNSLEEDDRYIYQRAFELTLDKAIGTKRKVYCPRNELPVISLGDKSYQVPEYSRDFHKHGSTRPAVSFGGMSRCVPDTFIPLQDLPLKPRQTFQARMRTMQKAKEIQEVVTLDLWKPAPLLVPSLHLPLAASHF